MKNMNKKILIGIFAMELVATLGTAVFANTNSQEENILNNDITNEIKKDEKEEIINEVQNEIENLVQDNIIIEGKNEETKGIDDSTGSSFEPISDFNSKYDELSDEDKAVWDFLMMGKELPDDLKEKYGVDKNGYLVEQKKQSKSSESKTLPRTGY